MNSSNQPKRIDPVIIQAYIDNELDSATSISVARKVDSDPSLAIEVARTRTLIATLKERLPRYEVPPHLLTRIETTAGLKKPFYRPTWTALAASVILAVFVSSGSMWFVTQFGSQDETAHRIVDGHIRGLIAGQPVDVLSNERHTVKPWFNDRVPSSPLVVDLSGAGFPLVGGRIDVVATSLTPTVVYSRRKHIISVFAIREKDLASPAAGTSINGYNVVMWRRSGIAYFAVSDLNMPELRAFAEAFQAAS